MMLRPKYTYNTHGNMLKMLNISDNEKVFVRMEGEAIRYQYDNHLGSACLELDEYGYIISYEEYHPFGTTSYRAGRSATEVSWKRYKYCGKERDEETGLYYCGARYYAAWLCRFVSCDPLQHKQPSKTPYHYCSNNPINRTDPTGMTDEDPPKAETVFIDSSTGKYLGSRHQENGEGFSVRSINHQDFADLQNNNFEPVEMFDISLETNSTELVIDYEGILDTINTIAEKKTRMINGDTQAIERGLLFVFDTKSNTISAIEADDSGSTNDKANFSFIPYKTYTTVEDQSNLIILGSMHTHVSQSITSFAGQNNLCANYGVKGPGVSEDDERTAKKLLATSYALATYAIEKQVGNIYKVDATGAGKDSKVPMTNLDNIRNGAFNIIRDVIKSNIPMY